MRSISGSSTPGSAATCWWTPTPMRSISGSSTPGSAAPTGQYSYNASGALVYRRAALDWHQLQNESEAFFLRIYGAGDYRWKGADLGVVVTKGRSQRRAESEADTLTIR